MVRLHGTIKPVLLLLVWLLMWLLIRHHVIHASAFAAITRGGIRAGWVAIAERHHLVIRRVAHIRRHLVLVAGLLASAIHLTRTRTRAPWGLRVSICTAAVGRAIPTRVLQIGGGRRCTLAPRSTVRLVRLLFRLIEILGRTRLVEILRRTWLPRWSRLQLVGLVRR
jgi:uncharacterized membrane protein